MLHQRSLKKVILTMSRRTLSECLRFSKRIYTLAKRAYYGCKSIRMGDNVLIVTAESATLLSYSEFVRLESKHILEDCVEKPYQYIEPEESQLHAE